MRPRQGTIRRRPVVQAAQQLDLGRKRRPDYWLLILCAALLSTGLIVVYAISPALSASHNVSSSYYVTKQLIAIFLSFVAFLVTANVPLKWWRQAYKPLLIIAGTATLLALLLPVNPAYPAHRWVRLGSFSFQSVELVKFAVLIALAGFLAARAANGELSDRLKTFKPLLIALVIGGLVIAGPEKVHAQSDLGSMGVIIAMIGTMCFVIGMPMKRLAMIAGILFIGVILVILPSAYRRERLAAFMNPEAHCQTSGYQACESLISVGSGGLIGLGLGSSVQAYGYQPEAANDSIFAIYAEKFGFVGSMILLGIFVAFFSRLKSIAERLTDNFSRLLVIGVLAWFSSQTLINIGGMIGLLPLKGITLPFISYGGTSVVFAAAAVGLVFQASAYASAAPPRLTSETGGSSSRSYRNNTLRRASY